MRVSCYQCWGPVDLPDNIPPGAPIVCPHCGNQGTHQGPQRRKSLDNAKVTVILLGLAFGLAVLLVVGLFSIFQPWLGVAAAAPLLSVAALLFARKLGRKSNRPRLWAVAWTAGAAILLLFSGMGFAERAEKQAEREAKAAAEAKRQKEIERTAPAREKALNAWRTAWEKAEKTLVKEGDWQPIHALRESYDKQDELDRLCEPIPEECEDFESEEIAPIRQRALTLERYAHGGDVAEERASEAMDGNGTVDSRWNTYEQWRRKIRKPDDCPDPVCTPEREEALAQADEKTESLKRKAESEWDYRGSHDTMTDKSISMATVESSNQVEFEFPYAGRQRATLQVRSHPRHGNDVILRIERGQFQCGIRGCRITVRFGDGDGSTFRAVPPADNSSTSLFLRGYGRFVRRMKKVDRAYVEAQFYQQGTRVFRFNVTGLEWPR